MTMAPYSRLNWKTGKPGPITVTRSRDHRPFLRNRLATLESKAAMNSHQSLDLDIQWETTGDEAPELQQTMARLSITVNGHCLTRNEDSWSRTIKNSVLVSLYPLATWLAANWWRLLHEPHPGNGIRPSTSWRIAHELQAVNHGFIWPTLMFASDGQGMQIWSSVSEQVEQQSVRYLNYSRFPAFVCAQNFQNRVSSLVTSVLGRLHDSGLHQTELAELWSLIREEQASPEQARLRTLEAIMGYDPEECPEPLLENLIRLSQQIDEGALSELAPALANGKAFQQQQIEEINSLAQLQGLEGKPELAYLSNNPFPPQLAPWEQAVQDAQAIRNQLNHPSESINNAQLLASLGISAAAAEHYTPQNTSKASVALPAFLPRKKHPVAKRFEYARLLADYLFQRQGQQEENQGWLVSSDLATWRQKYQRAFAAELLCPIDGLKERLQDDYSESAIEEAAEHFDVSTTTVSSLLLNNGLIETDALPAGNGNWPYAPAAKASA